MMHLKARPNSRGCNQLEYMLYVALVWLVTSSCICSAAADKQTDFQASSNAVAPESAASHRLELHYANQLLLLQPRTETTAIIIAKLARVAAVPQKPYRLVMCEYQIPQL